MTWNMHRVADSFGHRSMKGGIKNQRVHEVHTHFSGADHRPPAIYQQWPRQQRLQTLYTSFFGGLSRVHSIQPPVTMVDEGLWCASAVDGR